MRNYRCLKQQEFSFNQYSIIPIRDADKYAIMNWRNEQISILRQKHLLTKENQDNYFKEVISKLFDEQFPSQIIFSVLENDVFMGYGGLVHIDWGSSHAEISFITATDRANVPNRFILDWKIFLKLIITVAQQIGMVKIYTYAYDLRPNLYLALGASAFAQEARLLRHVKIEDRFYDVLIHSFFIDRLNLRLATLEDVTLYYNWANDPEVRSNSFNTQTIKFSDHEKWFSSKLQTENSYLFVAHFNDKEVGQIRFDLNNHGEFEIDFSIEESHRGRGFGGELVKTGTNELILNHQNTNRIIGKVKKENEASKKAFLNAGYKLEKNLSDLEIYSFDKIK